MTPRGRKLSLTLTVLLLVFLLVLVMLPYGIKWVLQDQLRERGAASASISDVNFNPFKGTLVIQDLDVRAPDGGRLRARYAFVDIDWLGLFERHINLRNIQLNSADVTLRLAEDGKWYLAGLSEPIIDPDRPAEPEPDAEAPAWTVQLQSLSLQSARLGYAMPRWEAGLDIDALEILEFNTRNVDQAARIDFSGELNDAPVRIKAELSPFAETPEYRFNTRVRALGLSQFQAFLPEGWRLAAGQFMVDGDWRIRQPEAAAWSIDYTGRLALAEADLAHPGMKLTSRSLDWNGVIGLALPAGEAAPSLTLEGELSNTGLDLQANAPGLSVQREQMSFTGTVEIADLSDPTGLSLAGSIDNRGLQVRQLEPARGLLDADRLQVQDLAIAGLDDIRVAGVTAGGLQALTSEEEAEAVFVSPGVAISDIRFEGRQRLQVKEVALGEAQIQLVREADGGWRGLTAPAGADATQEPPAGAEGEAADAREPVKVSIGSVTLAGGSTLTFTDRSVEPAYVNEVNLERFQLEQIDTGAPDTPLQLALEAKSEKYSGLTAAGWIKPFGEQLSSAIELSIEHLSLPPLSPYMAMTTGYSIRSGSVSVDSRIDIDAGQMNIRNDLRLDQFHVKPVSEEQRQRIDQKLSMPLGTALSTLRDDNDNIALSLPVTGSVADPSFDVSDAINQALAKALKTAAVSYIKLALQPYGSLITIGQFVGEKMSHIRLEPVAFANGSAALDQDAGQYLQKIRDLLENRPELQLRICGYAVPADRAALREQRLAGARASTGAGKAEAAPGGEDQAAAQTEPGPEIEPIADQALLDLAEQRARAVQDTLVQSHGVDPGRLFVCQPELESDPDARARAALNL
ncbi:MAG: hypothetical protein CMN57_08355 [Gammaproteobacteria bacterium]|nr:hypothetical protein [Gammaproteobacteria bacterium]